MGGVIRMGLALAFAPCGFFLISAGLGAATSTPIVIGAGCLAVALTVVAAPAVHTDHAVVAGATVISASKRPPVRSGRRVCRMVIRLESEYYTAPVRIVDRHTPIDTWPYPDSTLPVEVSMAAPRRIRVAWDDATPHGSTAGRDSWRRLVGRVRPGRRRLTLNWPWREAGVDGLLEDGRAMLAGALLGLQGSYGGIVVRELLKAPDLLAMNTLAGVSPREASSHVHLSQHEIFERTATARATAIRRAIPTLILVIAIAALVLPKAILALAALLVALVAPDRDARALTTIWPDAIHASHLGATVFYIASVCLTVLGIAAVRASTRIVASSVAAIAELRRQVRDIIGQRLRDAYQTLVNAADAPLLQIRTATGLAGLDATQLIHRSEAGRLRALTFDLDAGAIAISGARGVGKSTILAVLTGEDALANEPDTLKLTVSAPVQYDAREFLLHLYARLCSTVLRHIGYPARASLATRFAATLRAVAANVARGVFAVALLTPIVPLLARPVGVRIPADHLAVTAYLVAAAALAIAGWLDRPEYADRALAIEAERRLQQTRLLQTLSVERHATIGRSGVDVGRSRSRALAEQPLSLPEVVDGYREFAARVADWWRTHRSGQGKLLIGIDEVDRITDPILAERFLNEIKAIFGVPHCVYIVSVSDEALANFERRVVRMKTVFDSAFDHHVRLRPLTLTESVELLRLRLPGVPDRFLVLCHCLSGGMPREVLRTARSMFDLHRESANPSTLTGIAKALVISEIQVVKRGFQATPPGDVAQAEAARKIAPLLADPGWPGEAGPAICRAAYGDLGVDRAGNGPAPQLAAALIFYGTVLEFFTDRHEVVDAWVTQARAGGVGGDTAGSMSVDDAKSMPRIADAMAALHRSLPVNAALAIASLYAFRADVGLYPLDARIAPDQRQASGGTAATRTAPLGAPET